MHIRLALRPITALLLIALALAEAPRAQVVWVQQGTSSVPGRFRHAMAYDPVRGRTVLFGGADFFAGTFADTWEWDGESWQQRSPATSPAARTDHAMVFDEARGRVVLFGGCLPPWRLCSSPPSDTWEWDGATWTQRQPANSPGGRAEHAMAYDAARQRVVLYGGAFLGDTWEWDGTNWARHSPAHSPGQRWGHAMAYDRARERVVLFGGYDGNTYADTWEWDGSDWIERQPAVRPPARWRHALVYDEARSRIVLFGGTPGSDTWEWDGTVWRRRTTPQTPSLRALHAMAYDDARERVVMFGGNADLDDTWEYYTTQPATHTAFGTGCPGSAGVPAIRTNLGERPWIGDDFDISIDNLPPGSATAIAIGVSNTQWGAAMLPLDLSSIGMVGCTLYVSLDVVVPVPNPAGTATWTLRIPDAPALSGGRFYSQGFAADPGATLLGVIASNASEATVGAR